MKKESNRELTELSSAIRQAFKIGEAAQILGISDRSVRRLISRGELRTINKLRHILIPAAEIERFLNG